MMFRSFLLQILAAAACGLLGFHGQVMAAEASASGGPKPGAVEPAGPAPLRVYQDPAQKQQARAMLGAYVKKALDRLSDARQHELAALASPAAWRRRQQAVRQRLKESLGDFGPKTPLSARTVGKVDRPDYVIEKVVFESQPRYYCTANFYVPKRAAFPRPGILLTSGHYPLGKADPDNHEACLGLVLKGYVALALDPTGQGERSEYFDPKSGEPLVPLTVAQHHYLSRPSWLVGRTLVGYRVWDAIRAVDYLVSRSEVDPAQIGVVGNSGGGIMALLTTACDERVKVCAAAHPGGSMEQTFLNGQRLPEADILGLIAPRPCAIVVGRDSGEAPAHQETLDDMLRFYRGLGADAGRAQMFIVDGVHDLRRSKRVVCYAWLNKWFHQERAGSEEPPLKTETAVNLNCTPTGLVVRDLHGETGQTLNAKLAEKLRPPRATPEGRDAIVALQAELRSTVARRIGLTLPASRPNPRSTPCGRLEHPDVLAEKLILDSEEGIRLPALILRPKKTKPAGPLVLHVADLGKPADVSQPSLALELARKGITVFSLDVRGAGETDPRNRAALAPLEQYDPQQFEFDSIAVSCAAFGTALLAKQAFDVVRATDYLAASGGPAPQRVVLLGEGLGGVWALVAAAFDSRPAGVITVGTVPSYKLIVGAQYYASRDYFWVPGALKDFDLPDLVALAAPRPACLIDPANAMLAALSPNACQATCAWPLGIYRGLGVPDSLRIVHTARGSVAQIAEAVAGALGAICKDL
jgi:cephalosporin-C deacetylase-like acetyl esterase